MRAQLNSSSLNLFAALSFLILATANAQEGAPGISASELAARLDASRQSGSAYIRARMEVKQASGANKSVLQLQAKERHAGDSSQIVFQVLWPKERKGEAVLLRRSGRAVTGSIFKPEGGVRTLGAADLQDAFLGSDLAYADVIENFFGWDQQSFAGTEIVKGVSTQVLESKPGKSDRSSYGKVRSYIDLRRMVPLRVEKFSTSGKLVRRIETTRVVSSRNKFIPANLAVSGPGGGSVTELDGGRIRYDVSFSDREFTPEGMASITTPAGASEE